MAKRRLRKEKVASVTFDCAHANAHKVFAETDPGKSGNRERRVGFRHVEKVASASQQAHAHNSVDRDMSTAFDAKKSVFNV